MIFPGIMIIGKLWIEALCRIKDRSQKSGPMDVIADHNYEINARSTEI